MLLIALWASNLLQLIVVKINSYFIIIKVDIINLFLKIFDSVYTCRHLAFWFIVMLLHI